MACATEDCDNLVTCRGLCKRCYDKARYVANHEKMLGKAAERRATEEYQEYAKAYKEANPEQHRNYKLKQYSITGEQYDLLLASQGNVCAICKRPETQLHSTSKEVLNLSVDHDHACCPGYKSCGKCIRGLLCHRCNRTIGLMEDDPDLLTSAAQYLKGYTA